MKRKILFGMILILLLLPVSAMAERYILSATNEICHPEIFDLYKDAGLYYTENEALAKSLLNEGKIEYYALDCKLDMPVISPEPMMFRLSSENTLTWHIHETEAECFGLFDLNGSGVRVGIIDSGLSPHKDIPSSKIVSAKCFIKHDEEEICDTLDYAQHGTAVAGMILGQAAADRGAVGIAPDAEIVVAKCTNGQSISLLSIIEAIEYCDTLSCDIINMSVSTTTEIEDYTMYYELVAMEQAINTATAKGIIVVAAAGNYGNVEKKEDFVTYPAGFKNVIGVGSVGQGLIHANRSQKNSSVFVSAPGDSILLADGDNENGYVTKGGTSFSAPFVSGMLALLKQLDKNINTEDAKNLLKISVTDMGAEGYDFKYGYGVVSGRLWATKLRGTNLYTSEEDGNLFGVSLDGDKTVLNMTAYYQGKKMGDAEYSETPLKDKTKECLGKINKDKAKRQFFWEKSSLKPLCASY